MMPAVWDFEDIETLTGASSVDQITLPDPLHEGEVFWLDISGLDGDVYVVKSATDTAGREVLSAGEGGIGPFHLKTWKDRGMWIYFPSGGGTTADVQVARSGWT